jgi:glycosyltransferase involved in cell wall biosynthesis
MIGISAIVATYRRKDELRKLLDSIIENNCPHLEIIIVDQNTDNLIDKLIAYYVLKLDITHLKISVPNQSAARNLGATKAKYGIICFPDDDCWFEGNALNKVSYHFKTHASTDLLVINWKQNITKYYDSCFLTKKEIFSFRSVGYVTYVLFFKRDVFSSLGGFIESIGLGQYIGGGEDTEITFRAADKDLVIYYDSSIAVNHKYTNINDRSLFSIRTRERAMGYLYKKYKLPYLIILRGFIAPLIHMLLTLNPKKWRAYYNIFLARIEGYTYAKRTEQLINEKAAIGKLVLARNELMS